MLIVRDRHLVVGLVPLPAPQEESHRWDEKHGEWRAALRELLSDLEKHPVSAFVTLREGDAYRRTPVHANGHEEVQARRVAYAEPPCLEVAIVVLGSPAVAAACYKLLKAWIDARAGRRIRLKFGGFPPSERAVAQRVLSLKGRRKEEGRL
jgi:hypothetical protein